jgi:hypothetical protein
MCGANPLRFSATELGGRRAELNRPAVDEEIVRRAHGGIVGRQEQRHARDIDRIDRVGQALRFELLG